MFETNNEIAKFWANGKLTAVKLNRKRNRKKKTSYDPDYFICFRVEVALFDTNTNKQKEFLYGNLGMDEIPSFIEALKVFGSKAYQYKIVGKQKMPSIEIFSKYGGYDNDGRAISTKLWMTTGGPDMNADFFIFADEASGFKNEKGAFLRERGSRSIRKLSMALSAEAAIAIASSCTSALEIINIWSAMGTLDENLDRVAPLKEEKTGSYQQMKAKAQYQQTGYAAVDNYGYGQMPAQGYAASGYSQQGYSQQGGYRNANYQW